MANQWPPDKRNAAPAGAWGGIAKETSKKDCSAARYTPDATASTSLLAIIRSDPSRRGQYWSIEFDGIVLVRGSREPELELARVLLSRGITGSVTFIDAVTGRPRSIIDIERAAKLTVREDRRRGPVFVTWRPMPQNAHRSDEGRALAAETALAGMGGAA